MDQINQEHEEENPNQELDESVKVSCKMKIYPIHIFFNIRC